MGEAAHAAYKGGLDASQAQQLKAVTDSLLRRAAAAAAGPPAAVYTATGSGGVDGSEGAAVASESSTATSAVAEGLFRHLDQNGDGRIRCGVKGV